MEGPDKSSSVEVRILPDLPTLLRVSYSFKQGVLSRLEEDSLFCLALVSRPLYQELHEETTDNDGNLVDSYIRFKNNCAPLTCIDHAGNPMPDCPNPTVRCVICRKGRCSRQVLFLDTLPASDSSSIKNIRIRHPCPECLQFGYVPSDSEDQLRISHPNPKDKFLVSRCACLSDHFSVEWMDLYGYFYPRLYPSRNKTGIERAICVDCQGREETNNHSYAAWERNNQNMCPCGAVKLHMDRYFREMLGYSDADIVPEDQKDYRLYAKNRDCGLSADTLRFMSICSRKPKTLRQLIDWKDPILQPPVQPGITDRNTTSTEADNDEIQSEDAGGEIDEEEVDNDEDVTGIPDSIAALLSQTFPTTATASTSNTVALTTSSQTIPASTTDSNAASLMTMPTNGFLSTLAGQVPVDGSQDVADDMEYVMTPAAATEVDSPPAPVLYTDYKGREYTQDDLDNFVEEDYDERLEGVCNWCGFLIWTRIPKLDSEDEIVATDPGDVSTGGSAALPIPGTSAVTLDFNV